MAKSSSLLISCILAFLLQAALAAKVRHFKWEVSYIYASPDCEEKILMAINGQFPGPTIRAKAGDTIHVELKNALPTEGVVIHWHGIRQYGTPWADGTASISQCAINPEETFVYRFVVDKAGTYFYHGHYGMQRAAGLYGSLIVDVADGEEEPFHYDGEFNLLLTDWYHKSIYDQMVGLSSKPFRWIGEPQNHRMMVVEADGNYVEPFTVDDMDIYSGESYSVLITTNQNPSSNYWISVGVRGRKPNTSPALAIVNYSPNSPSKLPESSPPITPEWNDYAHSKSFTYKILARQGTAKPPPSSDRQIALGSMRYGFKNAFDASKPPESFPSDYDVMKRHPQTKISM